MAVFGRGVRGFVSSRTRVSGTSVVLTGEKVAEAIVVVVLAACSSLDDEGGWEIAEVGWRE